MRSEFEFIRLLNSQLPSLESAGVIGIGDDCAVLPVGGQQVLLSTDALVHGVHFRREYCSAEELGMKLLAVNLSDIAAMGGSPYAATIAITRPADGSFNDAWFGELYQGLAEEAKRFGVMIVGGNVSAGVQLSLTMTIVGLPGERLLLRSGAQEGDEIWVSGVCGTAGLGLELVEQYAQSNIVRDLAQQKNAVIEAFLRPTPQLALGRELAKSAMATAAIDTSDGFFQDLGHLLAASQKAALVSLADVPIADAYRNRPHGVARALSSGEDYQLLFTAPPEAHEALRELSGRQIGEHQIPQLTRVGTVLAEGHAAGTVLLELGSGRIASLDAYLEQADLPGGFSHF